jgi:tetraacyldisaccharide 4'-kinase
MKSLEQWLQRQWYGGDSPNPWLLPLEQVFKAAVRVRRLGYVKGLKPSRKLPAPVIVVGNLTVGGVGKTPLVIALVELLREAGYRPGVISRGYGGLGAVQPLAVTPSSDPAVVGDESLLTTLRTGAPVCVHRDRYAAGQALLAAHDCDVIVADDGLQHYGLARDVEIAVVDGDRRFGNGHLLPAGPLREPVRRLGDVDLVVCRGRGLPGEFSMSIAGVEAVNLLAPEQRRRLSSLAGNDLVALAGIGNPASFFQLLSRHGLNFEARVFPDHHRFSPDDLPRDGRIVLMTEKDAVKCRAFATERDWHVPVSAVLPDEFRLTLINLIKVKCDGQQAA